MILRIILGVVAAAAILGVGYVVTNDGSSPSSTLPNQVGQPRVVQPVAPSSAQQQEQDAIGNMTLRGN